MSSSPAGFAKAGLRVISAAAWSLGFRILGLLRSGHAGDPLAGPRAPGTLRAAGGAGRVLVIAPHADDEVIGCGGALLAHHAVGDAACVVYVTDGGRSRALGLARPEMIRRRAAEAQAAAALLGAARVEAWGLSEGEWSVAEAAARLAALIAEWRPQIIYAPSRLDYHPDHRLAAAALAQALDAAGDSGADAGPAVPMIRVYQIQVPLTAVLVNFVAPIDSVSQAHAAVIAAYETQRGSIERTGRMRRYAARRHRAAAREAEEFWQLSPAAFCALHRGDPAAWPILRGMRPHPLSDPLAYVAGRAIRRRALATVGSTHPAPPESARTPRSTDGPG